MLARLMPGYRRLCQQPVAHGPAARTEALSMCLQGFLQTALVVSSFHVLDIAAADGVVERTVRILYGGGRPLRLLAGRRGIQHCLARAQ